jgi:nicotinate-nucleotide adenylyltransferase
LAAAAAADPHAELFFLMGADSLADLSTWKDPGRICQLATVVVVRRPGSPPPDFDALAGMLPAESLAAMRQCQVEMPLVDLRSSDLRAQVATGRSIRYRTPRAVEKYIETNGLYRQVRE